MKIRGAKLDFVDPVNPKFVYAKIEVECETEDGILEFAKLLSLIK